MNVQNTNGAVITSVDRSKAETPSNSRKATEISIGRMESISMREEQRRRF